MGDPMTTTRTTDVDEDTEHVTCDACRQAWTEQVRADTRWPRLRQHRPHRDRSSPRIPESEKVDSDGPQAKVRYPNERDHG